jgi:hypothetical protein
MRILVRCPRMLVEEQSPPKVHLLPSVMSRFQQKDDRSLTPPVSANAMGQESRCMSILPSPYPSGSNSSLSGSTTTLRQSSSSRPPTPRRSTSGDSPTAGPARRLPTTDPNASSTSLVITTRDVTSIHKVTAHPSTGPDTPFPHDPSSAECTERRAGTSARDVLE